MADVSEDPIVAEQALPPRSPRSAAAVRLPIWAGWAGGEFAAELQRRDLGALVRGPTTTLQVNVGKLCNQACHHCHVEAGPKRTEIMPPEVFDAVLALLARSPELTTVDITGGAPELTPGFRHLVAGARRLGRHVIDRCNLTVLFEPGMEDLAPFLADHEVEIVASLPCYGPDNVDAQRGKGVFDRSIRALQLLNRLGYGGGRPELPLHLVYNPLGPSLPPPQDVLEKDYQRELDERFGVRFDRLYTITNMPIRRFADQLRRSGRDEAYMSLLVSHFNPATVEGLMCRSLLSVGWQGQLHDCDFNQMLEMPLGAGGQTIFDLESVAELAGRPVATGNHCYACTAGSGSSCGGALSAGPDRASLTSTS